MIQALVVGLSGVCLVLAAVPARAADSRADWDLLSQDEPAEMRGYHPEQTLVFTIPPGWTDFRDAQLAVAYLASPDMDPAAVISVDVNGTPVAVLDVTPGPGDAVVDLPADRLATGVNEVRLDALLPLATDAQCVDPAHPARWLVLGEVSVEMSATPVQLDIRDYPGVLAPFGPAGEPALTFVMPVQPRRDELSALSSVAFAAAKAGIEGEWAVRLDGDPTADAEGEGATIRIGSPPGEALAGAAGRAWLERTDRGAVNLSLAAGPDGSLAAVADALGDPRTLFPMEGGSLTVTTGPDRVPAEPLSEFSLAELGYGPRTIHGTGPRSLIYAFDVPAEWSPEGTYLTADVVTDTGRFAIALNGSDVTRQTITGGDTPEDIDLIEIDPAHMRPGRNYLRFTFDLDDDARCMPQPGGPGGSVGPATRLRITHGGDGGRLDLADFHEMFAAETDMTNLLIVLPDDPTAEDLEDLVDVARALRGSSSRFAPRAAAASDLTEADLDSHMIILGERSRQWMIGLLDDALPLQLAADGTLPDAARMDLAGVPAAPGIVELAKSPWDATRRVIAVTGAAAAGYDAALSALTTESDQTIVRGQVALVGRAGEGAPLDVLSLYADDPAINPGSAGFIAGLPVAVRVGFAVVLVIAVGVASTFLRRHPIRVRRRARTSAEHSA